MSCIFSNGNDDDVIPMPQSFYNPVIMSRTEFESAVTLIPNQEILKSGKIYVKGDFLFINEVRKGFHVFNYSDVTNPQLIAFIKIPGATDLAVRNNKIYINQAVDLVTLEYDSVSNTISVLSRNRNIFPPMLSPDGFPASSSQDEVIVDYIQI